MKKAFILIIIFLFITQNFFSKEYKNIKSCEELINQFFILLQEKKANDAVNLIFKDNPWIEINSEAISNTIKTIKAYNTQLGELLSYEKIITKQFTDRILIFNYLGCYERQPKLFVFIFYKPKSNWNIYSFSVDDEFDKNLKKINPDEVLKSIKN